MSLLTLATPENAALRNAGVDVLTKAVPFTVAAYAATRVPSTRALLAGAGMSAAGLLLSRGAKNLQETAAIAMVMAGLGALSIGVAKRVFDR